MTKPRASRPWEAEVHAGGADPTDVDVVVVGAGPSGASTAFHLARSGGRVLLLDRARFPRDKECGGTLSPAAVRIVEEMGASAGLKGGRYVHGLRVSMRGRGTRLLRFSERSTGDPRGMVVTRSHLDQALAQCAVGAGAEFWEEAEVCGLLWQGGVVSGVEMVHKGVPRCVRAGVVVAADGAASLLTDLAGLGSPLGFGNGVGVLARCTGVNGLTDWLEHRLPIVDPTDRFLLPSVGWVFPSGGESAWVGVSVFEALPPGEARTLFDHFWNSLRQEDPRFRHARADLVAVAPVRFDFSPDRVTASGFLRVGDAGGLGSPFTGEGIAHALESGRLAASAIPIRSSVDWDPQADLSGYARSLGARFAGHLEAGKALVRRYRLMWHVVESTFDKDGPLFALTRQTLLLPGGLEHPENGALRDDVGPLLALGEFPVRADLLGVGELLIGAVRGEWPFLAGAFASERDLPSVTFRPALFLLLAGYLGNRRELLVRAAVAIELGYLAMVAQSSVVDEAGARSGAEGQMANWGNMFALTLGDYLMGRAYTFSAQLGPGVSDEIARALSRACEGRVRDMRRGSHAWVPEAEHLEALTLKTSILFELPCRLGARLGELPHVQVEALTEYGRQLGPAFQLTDDVLACFGRTRQFGIVTAAQPAEGVYGLTLLRLLRRGGEAGERLRELLRQASLTAEDRAAIREIVRDSGVALDVLRLARQYAARACAALAPLPEGPVRRSLMQLTDYVVGVPASQLMRDLSEVGDQN